jgi:small subunit ribosomal protein SAe
MFFYRDPEEVEKEQQEAAEAKAEEPGFAKWDVGSAPQAGAINPGLVESAGTYNWIVYGSISNITPGALDWADEPAPAAEWAAEPAAGGWE